MSKRRGIFIAVGLVFALGALFYAGPRIDTTFHARPIQLPADLDRFLAESEHQFPVIVPGAERRIIWANPSKAKTPIALVYLHGFSATRQEVFPLCERVAAHFGANLYYARMTGHGLDGGALAAASVSDWLNDAVEAMAIGQRIGDRVIIIGTSTGGTLAAWLAMREPSSQHACILLSPNFGLKDRRATLLTWPWAREFVPRFFGAERHRAPQSEAERRYWTTDYPTIALLPMAGLVKLVNGLPLEAIRWPLLIVYSQQDEVADPQAIERTFARIGSPQKWLVPFDDRANRNHHVLAGDIMAPANTERVAGIIIDFVSGLGVSGASAQPAAR